MSSMRALGSRVRAYSAGFESLLKFPSLLVAIVLLAVGAALASGLGIGLLIPLLRSADSGALPSLGISTLDSVFADILQLGVVERIRFVAIALTILTLAEGLLTYLVNALSSLMQVRLMGELREQVFRQLLDVEIRFIYAQITGDLLTTLMEFTYRVSQVMAILAQSLVSVFTVLIYLYLMLAISWQLAVLALVWVGLMSAVLRGQLGRRIRRAASRANDVDVELRALSLESLDAMKLIRVSGKEESTHAAFAETQGRFGQLFLRRRLIDSLSKPLFQTINTFSLSLLLFASSFLLPADDASLEAWIGSVVPFIVLIFRLIPPTTAVNSARIRMEETAPELNRINAILDRSDKPYLPEGNQAFHRLAEGIVCREVTFWYIDRANLVLDDVTFSVPQGKLTAIVGASGAGKTTLVDLIVRLYDPQQGQILVDGIDLRSISIRDWQSNLAVVGQETHIFNDTVRSNLLFLREAATDEQLARATRLAHVDEFVDRLPEGLDTRLGERGVMLSAGQRQRLAIARAILSDRELLILDEATSSLDSVSEQLIQSAIQEMIRGRTVLAIAHRLSTIQNADNIVVLDHGRVVEQGTHDELAAAKGTYAGFVELQRLHTPGETP